MNVFVYLTIILWFLLGFYQANISYRNNSYTKQLKILYCNLLCALLIILGLFVVAEFFLDFSTPLGGLLISVASCLLGNVIGLIVYIERFYKRKRALSLLIEQKLSSFITIFILSILLFVISYRHIIIYPVSNHSVSYVSTTFYLQKIDSNMYVYYPTYEGELKQEVSPQSHKKILNHIMKINPIIQKGDNFLYGFDLYGILDIRTQKRLKIKDDNSRVAILKTVEEILNH
ncbi:MAG: hypothetical protein IKW58_01420 [Alphaproteobacteria bacterium]|nr:hypothetical protein [Alphaproteobacteria bacterium]